MRNFFIFLCASFVCAGACAQHILETMTLKAGWNAIYLESTPDDSATPAADDPNVFFSGELSPVTTVCAYVPNAYDDTEQYDAEGGERNQKPVSYKLWLRDGSSTLPNLKGGTVYLIYADADCAKTFYGIPATPHFTWRKVAVSDTEVVINLIGVSLVDGAKPYASAYFKEGPFGTKGTIYNISGTGDVPSFKPPFTSGSSKVEPGKAYALTATYSGSWPGVMEIESPLPIEGVFFEQDKNVASIRLKNRGTVERAIRVTYVRSANTDEPLLPIKRSVAVEDSLSKVWTNVEENVSWEYTLSPEAMTEIVFGVERASLDRTKNNSGVLVFEDLGGSQMRVRVPVRVAFPEADSAAADYPTGLWMGKFMFYGVTYNDDGAPMASEGTLKPTVMFYVDNQKRMTMLQRVSVVQDTNGTMRVFKDFNDAKAVSATARRLSSLMLDPDNQLVAANSGTFGEETSFTYTVEQHSAGNPFLHVWHPDHDGRNATYDGEAKPGAELWSVTNTVTIQFRELGSEQPYYSNEVEEIRAGRVRWQVEGLRSIPIAADGIFSIQRILPVKTLE